MDGDDIAKASAPASRRRMTVSETSVPALPRGARLRYDESRGRWVLLVPERVLAPDDIAIDRRIVYAAEAVENLPEAARAALPDAVALLHSPRAARLFARLVDPTGIAIAAISPAALAAAGAGWRIAEAAERPTDASLLAVAAKLCNQRR